VSQSTATLFAMYEKITGEDLQNADAHPAVHTMGGLWVDYNLQTTIPTSLRAVTTSPDRRQPPRCFGPMQGPGRRLFIIPPLAITWPRRLPSRLIPNTRFLPGPRPACRPDEQLLAIKATARPTSSTRLGCTCNGVLRHGPQRREPTLR
jgi:hypothetical protein